MELTGLKGRVAVVTGAARARGIGRDTAVVLGKAGCSVVVTGRKSSRLPDDEARSGWRGIHSVVEEIQAAGGKAAAFEGDLAVESEAQRLADFTASTFGAATILVNNAAANRGDDRQPVTDLPLEAWHTVMNTNNDSVFLVSRAFARQMLGAGNGGSIVNISSIAGKVFGANTAAYASSKAAMQAITKVMARELGPNNIRVNAICPGLIDTARMDDLKGQEGWDALVDRSSLGRAGEPIDIAWMVAFLCSEQARWISGQAINVDGGSVLEA